MPEDSITYTLTLGNGVKLTWPSSLSNLALSGSVIKLLSNIDHLKAESTKVGYPLSIGGITLSISKGDGSRLVSDATSTGHSCGSI